jgi:hypothetical protein
MRHSNDVKTLYPEWLTTRLANFLMSAAFRKPLPEDGEAKPDPMTGWTVFSVVRDCMPNLRSVMQIIVSFTLMAAAIYVMIGQGHDIDSQKWASGTLGAIMTYWLTGKGR